MMVLQVLGYLGLAVLVCLAVIWSLGVRFRLNSGLGVINGALFFVACAVVVVATRSSYLHSLWMVPAGYLLSGFIIPAACGTFGPALAVFRFTASLYANLLRIGIPAERIRAAQEADTRAVIDNWAKRHGRDGQ